MGCEFQSKCPACVRMYAFEPAIGRGLCAGESARCARYDRLNRDGWAPVTLMPNGETMASPLVRRGAGATAPADPRLN